ncbi:MAG: hypothetical protein V4582_19315 [Pseudomonadota bacterium]
MKRLISALLLIGLTMCTAAAQTPKDKGNANTDISLELVDLDPPSGSTLMAGEPINIRFKYKYARPNLELPVWAKILDEKYNSTYQGSVDFMQPGSGIVERFVFLSEPGTVKNITLVVKDNDHRQIYARDVKVNYKYVRNPRAEAKKNDGKGSRIVAVRFNPASPAVLKIGATVKATLDYAIFNADGLDMSIEPISTCNLTYSGMTGPRRGVGKIEKTFSIGEPCTIKKVKVEMINAASQHVFEQIIDVNFEFVK